MLLGRSEAQALGLPGLPIAVVTHPLVSQSAEELRASAEAVAGEVLHILTTPPEQLAAEYRERVYVQPRRLLPQTERTGASR